MGRVMYGAPRQEDYNGDAELVPSGLRVYRHYKMSGRQIGSTITCSGPFLPGVNTAECFAVESSLADKDCGACYGKGTVYVKVAQPPSPEVRFNPFDVEPQLVGFDYIVKTEPCSCLRKCAAPNRSCTCGFYASYSPDTDFFRDYMRQGLMAIPAPPVFSVVEASGRVLMGSRGVRAEKMRVVAMCLDMEHVNALNAWAIGAARLNPHNDDQGYGGYRQYRHVDSLERLLNQLDSIALEYGVKSYGRNVAEMIRDHPQPNLSHLIDNQETREVPPWPT